MQSVLENLNARARLDPALFGDLAGWNLDDHGEAFSTFLITCAAATGSNKPLRSGASQDAGLTRICNKALNLRKPITPAIARTFFEKNFRPHKVTETGGVSSDSKGFVTGYYEPVVSGSLTRTAEFTEPLLALPAGHVVINAASKYPGIPQHLTTARKHMDGKLRPYPERRAIQAGISNAIAQPIVWVRDAIEAFMIHVQGSAKIRLPNGEDIRIKYAGRNGHPYTSIGKILAQHHNIPPSRVTMDFLKNWVRSAGQRPGSPGRELMNANKSYIFFQIDHETAHNLGPIGGAGVNLTAKRSIAIDRNIWPYGLPFWIDAHLPWQSRHKSKFQRLMIAQDTGSAILGPARGDIFFGSGELAGSIAGAIRHPATFFVLLPR